MPRRSLSHDKIYEIIKTFEKLQNISSVQKKLGYNYRTIIKYLPERKSQFLSKKCSIERIIELYNLTGSLTRVAIILETSKTSVWRLLAKNNIKLCKGTASWKRLYLTLRRRVSKSEWRQNVLKKYDNKCSICKIDSQTVHHIKKLSDLRDQVLREYPLLNPYRSYSELRKFTDIVMELHKIEDGIVLCTKCHELVHSK